MKTTNKVQKAAIKFSTVIVSFVLISLTVGAQDIWEGLITNYQSRETVFAFVENTKKYETIISDNNLSFSRYSDLIEESIEETLELETWIINEHLFTGTALNLELETENPLEIENWMTDETIFNAPKSDLKSRIKNDDEEKLTLENWMIDNNVWKM